MAELRTTGRGHPEAECPAPIKRSHACVIRRARGHSHNHSQADQGDTMTFIQIIEYRTSRIDELGALMDEWLAQTDGKRSATRSTQAQDREQPGTFVQIVEFPSYEVAMANSELPETSRFAARMAALCDAEPTFRNLDVVRAEPM